MSILQLTEKKSFQLDNEIKENNGLTLLLNLGHILLEEAQKYQINKSHLKRKFATPIACKISSLHDQGGIFYQVLHRRTNKFTFADKLNFTFFNFEIPIKETPLPFTPQNTWKGYFEVERNLHSPENNDERKPGTCRQRYTGKAQCFTMHR